MSSVISDNIEVLVFGKCKEKFIERVILNRSYSKEGNKATGEKNKFSGSSLNNNADDNPGQQQSGISVAQARARENTYFKNINKLLNLNERSGDSSEDGSSKTTGKASSGAPQDNLRPISPFLTWAGFKRYSTTISTKNFWVNVNFNLVNDMFLDPYINNFVSANIHLLVITFDSLDNEDRDKCMELYNRLATSKPPSSIKYQSQMLLLQSGYYQAYNDNIVLALCELPEIEQVGPCFLAEFGEKSKKDVNNDFSRLKFEGEKLFSCFVNMDKEGAKSILAFYKWVFQTHQQIKYSSKLTQPQIDEIITAVAKSASSSARENQGGCDIF